MKKRFPGFRRNAVAKKPITAGDILLSNEPFPDLPRDPVRKVPRPATLSDHSMFVVMWDREIETYTLVFRDNSSFDLGEGPEALTYLTRALGGDEMYAGQCLDCACNFVVAVCEPSIRRAILSEEFLDSVGVTRDQYVESLLKPVLTD